VAEVRLHSEVVVELHRKEEEVVVVVMQRWNQELVLLGSRRQM